MLHLQRAVLSCLILWLAFVLSEEVRKKKRQAVSGRPHVLAPRHWRLGTPYVEDVRKFAEEAASRIPDGELVGVLVNPRLEPTHRPIFRMWMAYLMPRQHIQLLPRDPAQMVGAVELAEPGTYLLAYRFRPVRIPGLETVLEHPLGGVYRVIP